MNSKTGLEEKVEILLESLFAILQSENGGRSIDAMRHEVVPKLSRLVEMDSERYMPEYLKLFVDIENAVDQWWYEGIKVLLLDKDIELQNRTLDLMVAAAGDKTRIKLHDDLREVIESFLQSSDTAQVAKIVALAMREVIYTTLEDFRTETTGDLKIERKHLEPLLESNDRDIRRIAVHFAKWWSTQVYEWEGNKEFTKWIWSGLPSVLREEKDEEILRDVVDIIQQNVKVDWAEFLKHKSAYVRLVALQNYASSRDVDPVVIAEMVKDKDEDVSEAAKKLIRKGTGGSRVRL
ncbi:MAG: hypothetical protein RTU30_14000 [Candidatus Thorarchaeota archaeon]